MVRWICWGKRSVLVLLLFQGFERAVGALQFDAFEHLAHVFAEAVKVFLAKRRAFGLLFRGQFALLGQTGQFIDSFNLFMFHGIFHPFRR